MTPSPGRTGQTSVRDVVASTLRGDRDDPTTLYSYLGGGSLLADDTDYLNLGFWRDQPSSYREAGDALATELVTFAGLKPLEPGKRRRKTLAIDVGFGFGEQDVLWARRFGLTLTGLNLTPPQIERAAERVRREGLEGRVSYLRANATSMPIGSGVAGLVLALECAFHFHLREDFFREAFRVLKPGGVLAVADLVTNSDLFGGTSPRSLGRRLVIEVGRRFWHIPAANLYGPDVYRSHLEAAGFAEVEIRSIGADTFPGIRSLMQAGQTLERFPVHERPLVQLAGEAFAIPYQAGWIDYVLVRAIKPGRAARSRTAQAPAIEPGSPSGS
ncbi:MAG: class I SAM-dependent methyltransferase [Dehalococcoidia bacterium]